MKRMQNLIYLQWRCPRPTKSLVAIVSDNTLSKQLLSVLKIFIHSLTNPVSDKASNARHVVLRDHDSRTLLIMKVNSRIGNNFKAKKMLGLLSFFVIFFLYIHNEKLRGNYAKTVDSMRAFPCCFIKTRTVRAVIERAAHLGIWVLNLNKHFVFIEYFFNSKSIKNQWVSKGVNE